MRKTINELKQILKNKQIYYENYCNLYNFQIKKSGIKYAIDYRYKIELEQELKDLKDYINQEIELEEISGLGVQIVNLC